MAAVTEAIQVLLSPVAAVAAIAQSGALYLTSEAKGHDKLVKIECFVAIQDTLLEILPVLNPLPLFLLTPFLNFY